MKKTTKKRHIPPCFKIYFNFSLNMDRLKLFIDKLGESAKRHERLFESKMDKELSNIEAKISIIRAKKDTINSNLSSELYDKLNEIRKKLLIHSPTLLLYKSAFVMLISHFDFLISDLLTFYYIRNPDKLSKEKDTEVSAQYSDINYFTTVNEIKEYLISKKVNIVTSKNLSKLKDCLNQICNIDCGKICVDWDKLNEAILRRNIIVHNNSIVNEMYLRNVSQSHKTNVKKGQKLDIKRSYLMDIFNEVYIVGNAIIQYFWHIWANESIGTANSILLNECVYNAVKHKDWPIVEKLVLTSRNIKHGFEPIQPQLDVNYCIALKSQNRIRQLNDELKKRNFASISPLFAIAEFALKNDKKNFYANIESAIIFDKISKEHFMTWPLFNELRKDPKYRKRINAAFSSINKRMPRNKDEVSSHTMPLTEAVTTLPTNKKPVS